MGQLWVGTRFVVAKIKVLEMRFFCAEMGFHGLLDSFAAEWSSAEHFEKMLWMSSLPAQQRSRFAGCFNLFISPASKARFIQAAACNTVAYLASAGGCLKRQIRCFDVNFR